MFDNVGITLLPGFEKGQTASFAGGDIVTIPKGSKRVDDAVDFMKFILSDEVQVELYAKILNMTTRGDMAEEQVLRRRTRWCRRWPKRSTWRRRPTR